MKLETSCLLVHGKPLCLLHTTFSAQRRKNNEERMKITVCGKNGSLELEENLFPWGWIQKNNTITNSNEHCTVKSILHYHKFLRDAQKVFVNQISDFFTESKKQTEVDKLENNTTVSKFLLITYCHCSENLVKHSQISYPSSRARLLIVDIATTAVLVPLCASENSASVTLQRNTW